MFSAMLLCCVLGQAQDGKLQISNPRATFGHLGAVRPKSGLLPGDVACFTFDILNLQQDAKGHSMYSVAFEVRDANGEVFFKQQPYNAVAQNFFGGPSLPCSAHLEIPFNAKPGVYSWTATIQDRLSKQTVTAQGKGEVKPADFGLVRIGTYADPEGRVPVPPVGVVGSTLYLNFSAVGFGRDKTSSQPDVKVEMRVLDENGKATFSAPITGEINKGIAPDAPLISLQYGLTLSRPGRFTVELTARCVVCNKSATVSIPIRALPME